MPGSQGAAGERNNVWDLEKPRSPKSGGAMEWVNHPHARGIGGRGWGGPRCFGTPPFQNHVPLPRGSQETLQHSHSRVGDPRTSAPYPCPRAPGPPPGMGLGRGLWQREGEERTHPELPLPPPPQPRAPAAVPARLLPPPLSQVLGSSPRTPSFFPFEPAAFKPKSRGRRGRRALSPAEASETQRAFTAEETETGDQDPLLPPRSKGPSPQPLLS